MECTSLCVRFWGADHIQLLNTCHAGIPILHSSVQSHGSQSWMMHLLESVQCNAAQTSSILTAGSACGLKKFVGRLKADPYHPRLATWTAQGIPAFHQENLTMLHVHTNTTISDKCIAGQTYSRQLTFGQGLWPSAIWAASASPHLPSTTSIVAQNL